MGVDALVETYPEAGFTQRIADGGVAPGQTAKQFVGKVALSATLITTVTLETVTALKTLYITDILIGADGTQSMDTRIQAAGVDIWRLPVSLTTPMVVPSLKTKPFATAGQAVTLVFPISTNVSGYYNIFGFEQ